MEKEKLVKNVFLWYHNEEDIPMTLFSTVVLYFALMAFGGWLLELVFRSFQQRKLVNPGFLRGPFVPVYGFGAVGIYLLTLLFPFEKWGVWAWLFVILMPSVVEYIGGWFTEVFFHLKLWDYSHMPLNLHGKICLLFSAIWGVLAVVTVLWIQPWALHLLDGLSLEWRWLLTGWVSMYFIVDFWFSARMYQRYVQWVSHLKENLTMLQDRMVIPFSSLQETQRYFRQLFEPLYAFPELGKQLQNSMKDFPESLREFVKRFLPRE